MTYKGYTDPRYVTTAEDLQARLDDVVLIDVRPGEDYAGGHIEGARHFGLYGLDLNDTAEGPLKAFLWMMETLFGGKTNTIGSCSSLRITWRKCRTSSYSTCTPM